LATKKNSPTKQSNKRGKRFNYTTSWGGKIREGAGGKRGGVVAGKTKTKKRGHCSWGLNKKTDGGKCLKGPPTCWWKRGGGKKLGESLKQAKCTKGFGVNTVS